MTTPQRLDLAMRHHQSNRLADAEREYRLILSSEPHNPDALHLLGVIAYQSGNLPAAIDLISRAVSINPNRAAFHSNLGLALMDQNHLEPAVAQFRLALRLDPKISDAHSNLGIALHHLGRLDESVSSLQSALALRPNFPEAHNGLGLTLSAQGRLDPALASLRRAISLRPDYADAWNNLGTTLVAAKQLDAAIDAFQAAARFNPRRAEYHGNLANALLEQGRHSESAAAFDRAVALNPNDVHIASNRIWSLHYHPGVTPTEIFSAHLAWAHRHADPIPTRTCGEQRRTDSQLATRNFPLRIAFLSRDFRRHSVAFFLLPLLENLDRKNFHVTCYSHVLRPDSITDRIRAAVDSWQNILELPDQSAAELIRADKIDILFDLAGHSDHHRLQIFAHKPAPIQATFLGYPNTTGMSAMDYRLTDPIADPRSPPGAPDPDALYTERLYRLPNTAWCFTPLSGSPPISPRADNPITFGCFNNMAKLTDPMLRLWSTILDELPNSRLILKNRATSSESVRHRIRQTIGDRVEFIPLLDDPTDHLATYSHVDIALDTFPYHGTTTTCEALWMGVPVITLAGQTHASRVGVSLLQNVGLPDLIAESEADYLRLAVTLANDAPRRADLRNTLRRQMQQSPLMDGTTYAKDVETAMRQWAIQGSNL